MTAPNALSQHCSKCKVSSTCPRRGSSPLQRGGRTLPMFCRIVGGYASEPVDPSILSEALRERAAKDGPCMSIAEVPTVEPSGHVHHEVVKVFHHPIVHPRAHTSYKVDSMIERSHRQERPTRS